MKTIITFLIILLVMTLSAQNPPELLWTQTYGGIGEDSARDIQQLEGGNFILASTINDDMVIIKLDNLGNILWEQDYNGGEWTEASNIIPTSDGGFIAAGTTYSGIETSRDIWIIKLDNLGNLLWDYLFVGDDFDMPTGILQTLDGNYVIAGQTSSYGEGCVDGMLLKLDQEGNLLWNHFYGGTTNENLVGISETDEGKIIFSGGVESPEDIDVWLVKTESDGSIIWEKSFDFNDTDRASRVFQLADGSFIICGYSETGSNAEGLLLKTDNDGELLWYNLFGGDQDELFWSMIITEEEEFILTGVTTSYGEGYKDIWLVKTDVMGNIIWDTTYGGISEEMGMDLDFTDDGGIIIAGYTNSFGAGDKDIVLLKYNLNVGIDNSDLSAVDYQLNSYPNPFNLSETKRSITTTISFSTKNSKKAEIEIFNMKGQHIRQLKINDLGSVTNEITWNGKDKSGNLMGSGVYLYQLKLDGKTVANKKMMMLK